MWDVRGITSSYPQNISPTNGFFQDFFLPSPSDTATDSLLVVFAVICCRFLLAFFSLETIAFLPLLLSPKGTFWVGAMRSSCSGLRRNDEGWGPFGGPICCCDWIEERCTEVSGLVLVPFISETPDPADWLDTDGAKFMGIDRSNKFLLTVNAL